MKKADRFDERQVIARAKAGNMAFFILMMTLFASCGLRVLLGREWATPGIGVLIAICPAAGAYIARCIYTGAFFGLREDGRMFLWLCVAWVVSGAAVVARALSRGGLVVDGMLTDHCLSILMALIYLAALVAMALKRRKDAREEAEE